MGYGTDFFENFSQRKFTPDADTGTQYNQDAGGDNADWLTLGTYNLDALRDALTEAANDDALIKVDADATADATGRDKLSSLINSFPAYRWIKLRVYAGGGIEVHPATAPDDNDRSAARRINALAYGDEKITREIESLDNVLATISADRDSDRFSADRGEFVEIVMPVEWLRNPRSRYSGIVDNEYKLGTERLTLSIDLDTGRLRVTAPGMVATHKTAYTRRGSDMTPAQKAA